MRDLLRLGAVLLVPVLFACGSSHSPPGEGEDEGDAAVRVDGGGERDAGGALDGGGGGRDAGGGGGDHWSRCVRNSQCTVAPASCCGSCGAATPEDMVGVNVERLGEQRGEACEDDGACPACAAMQDPHLIATCEVDTCRAIDLRSDPATECASAGDCVLWVAACGRCDEIPVREVIAVSSPGRVSELLCDEGFFPPPCAPVIPGHLGAACELGRCVVVE